MVMKPRIIDSLLIVLLIFLGLGALFGGGALILSPSGELLKMPLSLLKGSPFSIYLIPGIILFVVLGVAPILTSMGMVTKKEYRIAEQLNIFHDMQWQWSFCIYVAMALIGWISLEMLFINAVHWIHIVYIFWGLAILFLALLPSIRKTYKKTNM